MSAGVAHSGPQLADMMLGIEQRVIMEVLSTFFAYAAMQWQIESFNYLPVTFLLIIFAMTCKHPDPNLIPGVNPQSCFQALLGGIVRRSIPDWDFSLFPKDMSHNPLLGFIWEEKTLLLSPSDDGLPTDMEAMQVTTFAETAMFSDIQQLREQILCAFFHYTGDLFYAFLNYRECFFLFEFRRPPHWAEIKAKYQERFPITKDEECKRSAVKFDKKDLPRPIIHYYARSLRKLDGSALSPVFLNAFKIATSNLGLQNEFPLFQMPPETTEEDLVQENLEGLQKTLDEEIRNQDAEVFEESSSDPIIDDPQDSDFAPQSSSESSDGSLSAGALESPLSLAPKSAPLADNSSMSHGCPRCRRRDRKKQAAKKKRAAKKKQAALLVLEDDNELPFETAVENGASASRRGDCTKPEPPRNVTDSLAAERLGPADGARVPEDTIRVHYPPSHGVILTDPLTPQEPPQTVAHKRESSDGFDRLPGSSDVEDEGVGERLAVLPTGHTAARAPKPPNAAAKTEHSHDTRSRTRAEPVAPALNQDDGDNATVGQRNPAGAAGTSQIALPAQAKGRAEASTRRSPPHANAHIAASRMENARLGTRSKTRSGSSSKQKRKHVGDSDMEEDGPAPPAAPFKRCKLPVRRSARLRNNVAVEAGGSAMPVAGPSNSQGLPARGPAAKPGKKKGRAA